MDKFSIHEKYNAVGFDMDHTLIQYKMIPFLKLVSKALIKYLVNHKNYPEIMLDYKEDRNLRRMACRAVYDSKNGNLLKLGKEKRILRVYHGFRRLKNKEIIEIYGKDPKFEEFDIRIKYADDWASYYDFYATPSMFVLALMVDFKASKKYKNLNEKDFYQIRVDLVDSLIFNYRVPDKSEFVSMKFESYFFTDAVANIGAIIKKVTPEMLKIIMDLRKKNKIVFIASNSYYEFGDLLLKYSIGEKWEDYFDFSAFHNLKPKFFSKGEDEIQFTNYKHETIENFPEWFKKEKKGLETVLIDGNAKLLNKCFIKKYGKDFKVIYFGDSIVSDLYYSYGECHYSKNWDNVFIFEELHEIETGLDLTEYENYVSFWGSSITDRNLNSKLENTFIYDFAVNNIDNIFSSLYSEECIKFLYSLD